MKQQQYSFHFEVYNAIENLAEEDAALLTKAREATQLAYAPYSNFRVGAVAKLANGKIVAGSNQENASFPAGMCAEQVLLASVSTLFPNTAIHTIAISFHNIKGSSKHPISPCGLCRQTLLEHENRLNNSIRLILGGAEGQVFIIPSASSLLPLSFSANDLQ
jgi:cytidine deaminase